MAKSKKAAPLEITLPGIDPKAALLEKLLENTRQICGFKTPEQTALACVSVIGSAAQQLDDQGKLCLDLSDGNEFRFTPDPNMLSEAESSAIVQRILPFDKTIPPRPAAVNSTSEFEAFLDNIKDTCGLTTNTQAILLSSLVTGLFTKHDKKAGEAALVAASCSFVTAFRPDNAARIVHQLINKPAPSLDRKKLLCRRAARIIAAIIVGKSLIAQSVGAKLKIVGPSQNPAIILGLAVCHKVISHAQWLHYWAA
jgi:hypothetical protein